MPARVSSPLGPLAFISSALVFSFFLIAASPTPALAQGTTDPHWGVGVSWTPTWTLMEQIRSVIFEDGEGTIDGSEFTIGLVRASTRGGDWGVSYVRKPFKDGSGSTETDRQCFDQAQTQCVTNTSTTLTQGVYLNGIQAHWFIAFATIKDRVQVGLNVGGGVASVKGNVVTTEDGFDPVFGFNPQTRQNTITFVPRHSIEVLPAKDELIPLFPLLKLEAEGAVILTPALKLKIAGGLNFPSLSMRVGMVYLIGAQ